LQVAHANGSVQRANTFGIGFVHVETEISQMLEHIDSTAPSCIRGQACSKARITPSKDKLIKQVQGARVACHTERMIAISILRVQVCPSLN